MNKSLFISWRSYENMDYKLNNYHVGSGPWDDLHARNITKDKSITIYKNITPLNLRLVKNDPLSLVIDDDMEATKEVGLIWMYVVYRFYWKAYEGQKIPRGIRIC